MLSLAAVGTSYWSTCYTVGTSLQHHASGRVLVFAPSSSLPLSHQLTLHHEGRIGLQVPRIWEVLTAIRYDDHPRFLTGGKGCHSSIVTCSTVPTGSKSLCWFFVSLRKAAWGSLVLLSGQNPLQVRICCLSGLQVSPCPTGCPGAGIVIYYIGLDCLVSFLSSQEGIPGQGISILVFSS